MVWTVKPQQNTISKRTNHCMSRESKPGLKVPQSGTLPLHHLDN